MTKYHVNDDGNAKECSAEKAECPFGKDEPHFNTKEEARSHYESTISDSFSKPSAKVKKTKVYRVGSLRPPERYFDDLNNVLNKMDEFKPEGRQGRHGGIFASPDMDSHSRWVLGSQWNRHEEALDSHEITVDANSVYVYDVRKYEIASSLSDPIFESHSKGGFQKAAQDFWESGITLAEWQEWAKENKPESGTWEIIMPASAMISTKKMTNKQVIENAPESRAKELNSTLEPRRYAKGLIWRKSDLTQDEILEARKSASNVIPEPIIKDLETIYKKNAYREDEAYNSAATIYNALQKMRTKRNETSGKKFSEMNKEEKQDVHSELSHYFKIIENIRANRQHS